MLGVLQFTTPLMLAGMALVGLPILSHLLSRRTRRRIVFPTIRLLRESSASQSALYKLRRLLLLILRCLAIVLIAWAFARPLWREEDVPSASPGAGAAVVMVLDTSASMSQQDEGVPLINSVQAVAGRVLNCLQEGVDRVNLVTASAGPRAALPQLTGSFALIRQELTAVRGTYERANLPDAIALAGKMLAAHGGQRRLVVLSDMQASNWRQMLETERAERLLPTGVAVTIVPIEGAGAGNVALAEPRAAPVQPIVGQPVQLTVQVVNHSTRRREVEVVATLDGHVIGRRPVALEAGAIGDAAFSAELPEAGEHAVVFSIEPDALPADNQAFLVVRSVRRIPVIVVGDDAPSEPGTSTYFLLRALAPRGDMTDALAVGHLTSADLRYGRIFDAEAVFLGYVGRLSAEGAAALHTYVNQGGGVVVLCGDGPVAANLKALAAAARDEQVLPWEPVDRREVGGGVRAITAGTWASPLLREFDPRCQEALGQVRFARVWTAGPLRTKAEALLTYDDGTPALTARRVGSGRLALANFSPALTASDLGKHGSFVALMQSLVGYLRPRVDWRGGATCGEPLRCAAALPPQTAAGSARVIGPDRKPCLAELHRDAAHLRVHLPAPRLPGFYQVRQDERTLARAAVNLDPAESDLRPVDPPAVLRALKASAATAAFREVQGEGPLLRVRGRPLWAWFVVAALGMIALELLLLAVWKK